MPHLPSPRGKTRPRLEIIPFIDIMFFLLATFMMVSLSMVKNQGISVNLPQVSTGAVQKETDFTTLTITESDRLYFNKQSTSLRELPSLLRELKAANADPKIIINSDGKAPFESAVLVLDEARKAGISKVSIQTKNKDKS